MTAMKRKQNRRWLETHVNCDFFVENGITQNKMRFIIFQTKEKNLVFQETKNTAVTNVTTN